MKENELKLSFMCLLQCNVLVGACFLQLVAVFLALTPCQLLEVYGVHTVLRPSTFHRVIRWRSSLNRKWTFALHKFVRFTSRPVTYDVFFLHLLLASYQINPKFFLPQKVPWRKVQSCCMNDLNGQLLGKTIRDFYQYWLEVDRLF